MVGSFFKRVREEEEAQGKGPLQQIAITRVLLEAFVYGKIWQTEL
jgi:hypothetical protein